MDKKCCFSTSISGELTCCFDGNFDLYGFPMTMCSEYPCKKYTDLRREIEIKGEKMKKEEQCAICGYMSDEVVHLPLYVIGSEGIGACLQCRITLSDVARGLRSTANKSYKRGFIQNKELSQKQTSEEKNSILYKVRWDSVSESGTEYSHDTFHTTVEMATDYIKAYNRNLPEIPPKQYLSPHRIISVYVTFDEYEKCLLAEKEKQEINKLKNG